MDNKPLIAIGLSFFEDSSCIGRCLSSVLDSELKDYVKVIAIDGRYRGYPANNDLSEDGSREIILDFQKQYGKDKIELTDYANRLERRKRQKYVDLAAKQGIPWLIILDSDEYIQCKKPHLFIEELAHLEQQWKVSNEIETWKTPKVGNVFQVKSIDLDNNGIPSSIMMRPRAWHHPEQMHYTTKHYWFANKNEILKNKLTARDVFNSQYKSLYVENLVIWHDQSPRSTDRQERRQFYEIERLPQLEKS